MDFALANDLKAAGFPQGGRGSWIADPNALVVRSGERVYTPTLEELIEACGDDFAGVERSKPMHSRCHAFSWHDEMTYGSDPCEAVARLWLALNKKV